MAVYREDVGYRTGVRAFFNRSVLVVFTHPCVIILICAMTPIAVRKSNFFFLVWFIIIKLELSRNIQIYIITFSDIKARQDSAVTNVEPR